jgi:hypothetical protein
MEPVSTEGLVLRTAHGSVLDGLFAVLKYVFR